MFTRFLSVLSLGAVLTSASLFADSWLKSTRFTFNKSVEVPGAVLPAGTYVFERLDSNLNRGIVRVFNADKTQTLATFRVMPMELVVASDKATVKFTERDGQPPAIKAITYPADTSAYEFVYSANAGVRNSMRSGD
jgi:hypothetical protein